MAVFTQRIVFTDEAIREPTNVLARPLQCYGGLRSPRITTKFPVVEIGQVFETRVWAELDATIECSRRCTFRVEMVATACKDGMMP